MANALAKLLNTTGPERTAWLERQLEPVKNALASAAYYVPPELRQTGGQVANALAMFSPGADVMDAAQSSGDMMDAARRGDFMGMAGAGAGIAAAGMGMFVPGTAKGYGSAAEEVAGLLRDGRGADITDEMIAKADPAELFDLYGAGKTGMDMPMDEASRMARAEDMGFMDNYETYHGTGDDIAAFRQGFRPDGSGGTNAVGVYSAYNPKIAETYAPNISGGNIMPLATRKTFDDITVEAGGANWNAIDMGSEASRGSERYRLRDLFPDAVDETGMSRTNSIARDARRDGAGSLRINNTHDVGGYYDPKAGFNELPPHDVRTDFYPNNIRSRFARFDPRLKHLANLSAAGAGVIGYNALRDERDRNEQGGM
jgi:hypothetical protein